MDDFQHLDDYSLMGIFDYLNFDELVIVASSNANFRALITDHYMLSVFRIHEKVIRYSLNEYEKVNSDTVIIKKNETILPFLRNFGHLVTSIQILGEWFDAGHAEEIIYYIEQYCSATLTELELHRIGTRLTVTTNATFPRVIRLKLMHPKDLSDMAVNRIYPALEDFTIETNMPILLSTAQFYSNLKCLNLLEYLYDDDDSGVREFLRLNPQINELRLRRSPTFNLLTYINEISTNLESLSIGYRRQQSQPVDGETVHFQNIKHFSMQIMDRFAQSHELPITFEHLETLEISADGYHIPLNLVQQNAELKSISLIAGNEKLAVRILDEAGPFRALEEIKMRLDDIDDTSNIRRFMEKYDTLKRFILIIYEFSGDALNLDAIQASFQDGWRITDHAFVKVFYSYDVYYVTLTRI